MISYAFREMVCRWSMPVRSIAFYGIDGSGKTTLVNAVRKELQDTAKIIRHCHFLPLFPWQAEPDSNSVVSDPHKNPMRDQFTSIIKIFYYWAYCWLAQLWPQRSSVVFLYDRYIPDMLVDPKRLRYGGSMKFLAWACQFLPQPDLSVVITIDPQQALQRKSEIPLTEATRQNNAYITTIAALPGAITVRGDLPVSVGTAVVVNHYFKMLAA
jgi:GTPase SAR1 family protein